MAQHHIIPQLSEQIPNASAGKLRYCFTVAECRLSLLWHLLYEQFFIEQSYPKRQDLCPTLLHTNLKLPMASRKLKIRIVWINNGSIYFSFNALWLLLLLVMILRLLLLLQWSNSGLLRKKKKERGTFQMLFGVVWLTPISPHPTDLYKFTTTVPRSLNQKV